MTGKRSKIDLAAMEGGSMASVPARLLYRGADAKLIWNVAFRQPWIHTSDHRAVVVLLLRGWHGKIKQYCQRRQTFPLQLPPVEEQDEQMCLYGEL